jgi:xanthine dehydrogenase accessory factor
MLVLIRSLLQSVRAGRCAVYCRLVETRGSTPQKAGAAMLVWGDGTQLGTLGGGCVEAEVKRRALGIIENGSAQIATFSLDNDYGWDDGLICGGRMQVAMLRLRPGDDLTYFEQLEHQLAQAAGVVEAIPFDAEKSGLLVPQAFLFDGQQRLLAHWPTGDSAVPQLVSEYLPELGSRPRPSAVHGVAYLPQLPRCRLLIVGGGHVGQAVANWAADLDFDVWVVDDRADVISAERFPRAQHRIAGDIGKTLADIEITPQTYCLIVTRGHNHDELALYHLADRGAAYVGMIGSKRKIKLILDDLLAEGIAPEALSRVYAPVGIDIGSQTVPEIAISILAELIAHRNLHGEVPRRPEAVSFDLS